MAMSSEVTVIELWPHYAECWVCDAVTPHKWGLAIDTNADLAPLNYDGEWGGVPACQSCYEAHAQGLLTADNLPYWRKRQQLIHRAMQAAFARED